MIPLPSNKRARVTHDGEEGLHALSKNPSSYDGCLNIHERLQQEHPQQFSHAHPTYAHQALTKPVVSRTNSSALLSPCHICHRKPTKKSDLDSFADCEGCGQRTCYICMRSCRDWTFALNPARSIPRNEDQGYSASFIMQDVGDENDQQPERSPASGEPKDRRETSGRDMDGWVGNGHRSTVCSRCCVERGSEGDVVCLGCLSGLEGA